MRKWDVLLENFLKQEQQRGLCTATLDSKYRELIRFGNWLKRKRPKPSLETINSDHIINYIKSRTAFRSKATVYRTVSILRGMGEYLTTEGYWLRRSCIYLYI